MRNALDHFLLIHNVLDIIRSSQWVMTSSLLRSRLADQGINIGLRTVQRHLKVLHEANIIMQVGAARDSEPNIWAINPHHSVNKNPTGQGGVLARTPDATSERKTVQLLSEI
jgi:hypothetical protein